VETIESLLNEFQKYYERRHRAGSKADYVKNHIERLSEFIGKTRLLLNAVYTTTHDVRKSYFNEIVRKTWETERDDYGNEWILVDRRKHG